MKLFIKKRYGVPKLNIRIRRQWNDWRIAEVDFSELYRLRWDLISGGGQIRSPQPFVYGYVWCNSIKGEIAHSCMHGEGPHYIKIVLIKKDNLEVWPKILSIVGPKPEKRDIPIHSYFFNLK